MDYIRQKPDPIVDLKFLKEQGYILLSEQWAKESELNKIIFTGITHEIILSNGLIYTHAIEEAFLKKAQNENQKDSWMVITADGQYYKVNAQWIIWYKNESTDGKVFSSAIWSYEYLKNAIKQGLMGHAIKRDPDYHT